MNDYEAHLSSYDHTHKQRLRDMKAMVKDPNASSRARKAEAKADGFVSIKMPLDGAPTGGTGAGFKKGGFKKSGFKSAFAPVEDQAQAQDGSTNPIKKPDILSRPRPSGESLVESDTEDEGYPVYDPRFPTE